MENSEETTLSDLKSSDKLLNSKKGLYSKKVINLKDLEKIKPLKNKPKNKFRKIFISILLVLFLALLLGGIAGIYLVIIPLQSVTASINAIQSNATNLAKDLEEKNISKLTTYTNNIQIEIDKIDAEIDKYDFLATTDLTKGYYSNFKIAKKILNKSSLLLDKTLPEVEELLLSTGFSNSNALIAQEPLTGEPKEESSAFTLVLKEMPQYLKLYAELEPQIIDILQDIKEIDPTYLPSYGEYNFPEILAKVNDSAEEFPVLSAKVQDILKQLPKLLGSDNSADYLLILQNETEMRASGGLLTAYGNMNFVNGEFGNEIKLTDMWQLERYTSGELGLDIGYRNIYGQDYLMYGSNGSTFWQCGSTYLRAQDAGIYPDQSLTMEMLADYYDQANRYNKKEYPDYDYILILNYTFAANLIKLIEPIDLGEAGILTSANLYDFIKFESDEEGAGSERKDIIKDIANIAKVKFLDLPIEKLPEAVSTIIGAFQAKDIALSSPYDKDLQNYFDKYGMSGRTIKDFKGDYFHLNEAQNCSLKLNRFIRDEVEQNIYINNDGGINRDVKVTWFQPQVYESSLEKQYSSTIQWSYRAWVRIFAPEGTKSFVSDGYNRSGYLFYRPITYFDPKMDKQISDNIIQFDHRRFSEQDPVYRDEINISYRLPDEINYLKDGGYQLLIQKHPGKSWGEKYKIIIHEDGLTYPVEFILDRDKVISYTEGVISLENYDTSLDWIPNLVGKVDLSTAIN